jgi:hypothetical protein
MGDTSVEGGLSGGLPSGVEVEGRDTVSGEERGLEGSLCVWGWIGLIEGVGLDKLGGILVELKGTLL